MDRTPACEAPQVAQFGGDQRPGDRADASDALDRVFHARKEPLNVPTKFGELFFKKLQLCDHRADQEIKRGVLPAGTQAFLCAIL